LAKCFLQSIRLPVGIRIEESIVAAREKEVGVEVVLVEVVLVEVLVEVEKAGALTHYLQQVVVPGFSTPAILYREDWYTGLVVRYTLMRMTSSLERKPC